MADAHGGTAAAIPRRSWQMTGATKPTRDASLHTPSFRKSRLWRVDEESLARVMPGVYR